MSRIGIGLRPLGLRRRRHRRPGRRPNRHRVLRPRSGLPARNAASGAAGGGAAEVAGAAAHARGALPRSVLRGAVKARRGLRIRCPAKRASRGNNTRTAPDHLSRHPRRKRPSRTESPRRRAKRQRRARRPCIIRSRCAIRSRRLPWLISSLRPPRAPMPLAKASRTWCGLPPRRTRTCTTAAANRASNGLMGTGPCGPPRWAGRRADPHGPALRLRRLPRGPAGADEALPGSPAASA